MKLNLYRLNNTLVFGHSENGVIKVVDWQNNASHHKTLQLASDVLVTHETVNKLISVSMRHKTDFVDLFKKAINAKYSTRNLASLFGVSECTVRSLIQIFSLTDLWKASAKLKSRQSF